MNQPQCRESSVLSSEAYLSFIELLINEVLEHPLEALAGWLAGREKISPNLITLHGLTGCCLCYLRHTLHLLSMNPPSLSPPILSNIAFLFFIFKPPLNLPLSQISFPHPKSIKSPFFSISSLHLLCLVCINKHLNPLFQAFHKSLTFSFSRFVNQFICYLKISKMKKQNLLIDLYREITTISFR